jgi:hypothetical protein
MELLACGLPQPKAGQEISSTRFWGDSQNTPERTKAGGELRINVWQAQR